LKAIALSSHAKRFCASSVRRWAAVKAKAQQPAETARVKALLRGVRLSRVPTEKKQSPLKVAAISLTTMPSRILIAKMRTAKLLPQGQIVRRATVHAAIVLVVRAVAEVEDLVAVVAVEEARAVVAGIEAHAAAAVVEIAATANHV
jgi:hypothetical protein